MSEVVWVEYISQKRRRGRPYYHNPATGETRWKKPQTEPVLLVGCIIAVARDWWWCVVADLWPCWTPILVSVWLLSHLCK